MCDRILNEDCVILVGDKTRFGLSTRTFVQLFRMYPPGSPDGDRLWTVLDPLNEIDAYTICCGNSGLPKIDVSNGRIGTDLVMYADPTTLNTSIGCVESMDQSPIGFCRTTETWYGGNRFINIRNEKTILDLAVEFGLEFIAGSNVGGDSQMTITFGFIPAWSSIDMDLNPQNGNEESLWINGVDQSQFVNWFLALYRMTIHACEIPNPYFHMLLENPTITTQQLDKLIADRVDEWHSEMQTVEPAPFPGFRIARALDA